MVVVITKIAQITIAKKELEERELKKKKEEIERINKQKEIDLRRGEGRRKKMGKEEENDKKAMEKSDEPKTGLEKVIDVKMKQLTDSLTNTLQGIGEQIKAECKNQIRTEVEQAENRLNVKYENKEKEKDKKIKELEGKIERIEKSERKNNIILWGVKFEKGEAEAAAKEILEVKMGVEVRIEKVWTIKDKAIGVKLRTFEEKLKIFEKRKVLKGTDIFLGDDMTEKEREVQKIVKEEAAKAKKNDPSKVVRTGYRKIKVDDKWYNYDEEKKKFFRKL